MSKSEVGFLHEHGRDANNALDEATFEREASETLSRRRGGSGYIDQHQETTVLMLIHSY